MLGSAWRQRHLIVRMASREVVSRYNGSVLGLAWSFFNPLLMLAIYTFVFSVVFKAGWSDGNSKSEFASLLFAGMIVHGLFAECINRAPTLVLSNANYVKKVIFPLEILPWVAFLSAVFHAAISIVVLLLAHLMLHQQFHWTVVFLPVVLLPLALATLGFSWFVSALGVYIRDVAQVTNMFTTALLFLSGVFYPVSSLPDAYRHWIEFNPLTYFIEESRNVLLFGTIPDFQRWGSMLAGGLVIAWLGFAWFQRSRRGFADVV
jgi:lipopolysaccharide transport system permease protein